MKNESVLPVILLSITIVVGVVAAFKVYSFGFGGDTSIVEAFLWFAGAVLSSAFTGLSLRSDG